MDKLKSFIKQYFVLVILIVLIILFGCLRPESFLTMSNMFTVIRQSSIMGIATIGLLFVMVAGGIDLSLGSVISVESVLVAVLLTKFGWGLLPAYLCGLAGGTLVGLVTGAIIVKTGIFPMIGTLALQIILQGIAYLVCGGMPVSNLPLNAKMIGQGYIGPIPIPAHEFHYYDSEVCGEAFLAEKPMSNRSWKCMISTDTVLAGYPHIHYYGNEKIPENFLEQCRRCREQEKRARERDRT